jgi:hypothetical protein
VTVTNNDRLDIRVEAAAIKEMYEANPRNQSFNLLLYGSVGTGKTRLAKTCRRPILIDSFDPGGTNTLKDEIKAGWIIADTRWESEDPKTAIMWDAWCKEMERRRRGGIFDQIGTLYIDSATTWSDSAMHKTVKKAGRPGGYPFQNDYTPTMNAIENAIRELTSLPCDVVLTAHEDVEKDEVSGKMRVGPLLIGKTARQKIPALFDEIYCTQSKELSTGVQYSLLTRSTGFYFARTRLGRENRFEMYETPDIKQLLRKAGLPANDKEGWA